MESSLAVERIAMALRMWLRLSLPVACCRLPGPPQHPVHAFPRSSASTFAIAHALADKLASAIEATATATHEVRKLRARYDALVGNEERCRAELLNAALAADREDLVAEYLR